MSVCRIPKNQRLCKNGKFLTPKESKLLTVVLTLKQPQVFLHCVA